MDSRDQTEAESGRDQTKAVCGRLDKSGVWQKPDKSGVWQRPDKSSEWTVVTKNQQYRRCPYWNSRSTCHFCGESGMSCTTVAMDNRYNVIHVLSIAINRSTVVPGNRKLAKMSQPK